MVIRATKSEKMAINDGFKYIHIRMQSRYARSVEQMNPRSGTEKLVGKELSEKKAILYTHIESVLL